MSLDLDVSALISCKIGRYRCVMSTTPKIDLLPGHNGVEIAVHRLGAGPAVIMLHGLSSSTHINWVRYGTAKRLADAGFEAIMIDQRVHGKSAAPQNESDYPADVLLLDMKAVIPQLRLDGFDLVGYSMGSRIALSLVADGLAPRRLILGGMGLEGLLDWKRRRQFFLDALDHFNTAKAGDRDFMAIQFMKTVKIDPIALRHLLLSMSDISRETLDKIRVPTLVLSADDDDDNGSADALVAALPDAQRGSMPGNHMTCIMKPEFGEAIVNYLAA